MKSLYTQVSDPKSPEIHPTVSFRFEKNIAIGDEVVLDANCCLWASENSHITIGNRVGVGPGTVIVSSNHSFLMKSSYVDQPMNEKKIVVGDDVWIGANCSILGGTSIGDGSIIGAGCVVFKSIPKNSVVIGGSRKLTIIERR